eukprot:5746293-Prymnesium_polylepis.1
MHLPTSRARGQANRRWEAGKRSVQVQTVARPDLLPRLVLLPLLPSLLSPQQPGAPVQLGAAVRAGTV